MSMYISNHFTETFKIQHLGVAYKVNKAKGVVTAIARFYMPYDLRGDGNKYFQTIGVAYVGSKDTFDLEKGKELARARAEKEAFIVFKRAVDKFSAVLRRLLYTSVLTSDKMQRCIRNQNKYIKTF